MNGKERLSKAKVTFAREDTTLGREGSSSSQGGSRREGFQNRSPPPEPVSSPTSSGSSSDSTGGPLTPPNLPHTLLSDPKAPTGAAAPDLNDRYGGDGARKPKLAPVLVAGRQIQWDMAKCPTKPGAMKHVPLNAGSDRAGCLPNGEAITSMEIIFDEALSDWPLHINAAGKREMLTIFQVWTAIHEHLQKLVSEEHFQKFLNSEGRKRVRGALKARTEEMMFEGDGIRRIDYMPSRQYSGLHVKAGKHGWEYHLACCDQ